MRFEDFQDEWGIEDTMAALSRGEDDAAGWWWRCCCGASRRGTTCEASRASLALPSAPIVSAEGAGVGVPAG